MRIETGNNVAVGTRKGAPEARHGRPEAAVLDPSRALVPVEPAPRSEPADGEARRRAVAPASLVGDALLAVQMIAAKLDLPQSRTLHRATAHEGEAAYDATSAVIRRRGPPAGAGLDVGA